MKTILSTFFILVSILFCEAKPSKNSAKTNYILVEDKIPDYVEKWLNDELANSTTAALENFDTPAFFTKKNAKIIGYIKGYDQTQGAKTGIFYYNNQLTRENKPRVIEIHKDGRFELELPIEYPIQNYFTIKNQVISFYVEPGQNLSILLDWQDIKQPRRISYPLKNVSYQGALSNINTNLLRYNPSPKSRDFQQKEEVMDPISYKKYMLQYKIDALNKISTYQQSGVIDKKTFELLENQVVLETYYYLFDYYSPTYSPRYGQGKRKANNIDDTEPKDYYDFIKEIPLQKQSILVSKIFSSLVNRLEFSPQLKVKSSVNINIDIFSEDFLDFLEKNNSKMSTKDKTFLQKLIKNKDKKKFKENKEQVSKFTIKYSGFLQKYNAKKRDILWRKEFVRVQNKKDSLAANLNIKNNFVYEIIQTRKLDFILRADIHKDKKWYWNELKKGIKSPHLLKVGDQFLNDEIKKPAFYKLPEEEKGSEIFKKLLAPYKGKVIVVQFWNPWSYYEGKGLERSKERRNLFADNNDVVFLHITNKSRSSKKKYDESVLKNGFTNAIRIPQDDYHYLRQLFRFNASIHDIIVAKDGVSIYDYEGTHQLEYKLSRKFNIVPNK